MAEPRQCPRCDHTRLEALAHSPVPDVWVVWACARCGYAWRGTEPETNTSRAAYPEQFKITGADLDGAVNVPPIPQRR